MRTIATALLLCLAATACSGSSSDDRGATASTASSTTTTTTTTTTTAADVPSSSTQAPTGELPIDPAPVPGVGEDPQDGRHLAFIQELDVDGATVTVDIAQWLSGDEADDAYAEETGDSSGVPNDYYIRNESTDVRTMTVATEVVTVAFDRDGVRERDIPTGEFTDYMVERGAGLGPFWITVEDGTVVEIIEQYVP